MNSLQYIFHGFFENSSEIYIQYTFHVIKNLHKEMHIFFSTIGDDGIRQYREMRVFSLQFFEIEYEKRYLSKIFHINLRLVYFNTYFTTFLKTVVKYIFNTYFTL